MAALGGTRHTDLAESSSNAPGIDDLARFVIDEHNKEQNVVLVLKKVRHVKEQVVSGTMYHITLEAAEGGMSKVYEARVWVKPWMDSREVQDFKLVGDA